MAKASTDTSKTSATKTKTTKSGRTKTVSRSAATPEQKTKRATQAVSRAQTRKTRAPNKSEEKGLIDLLEHALRDMYYAEKKIYRSLPKMIKAADDEALAEALSAHREETQSHIEALEASFEAMGLRAKGEKCDAIDGILEEAEGILEDFGGTLAGDAAIIFSARAVEHYEICRYSAMAGFADALGLSEVHQHLSGVLAQEKASDEKLQEMAEGSINEAASEYDDGEEDEDHAPKGGKSKS